MAIRERQEGTTTILEPIGRLEGNNLTLLEERIYGLLKKEYKHFVIDLANVERISSLGLRLFLTVARRLGPSDGDLVLCSMNEDVQEVFDTVGLARVFSIASSQDEAVRFLRQGKGKAREISRLAADLLRVAENVARGASGIEHPADEVSVRRVSALASGLLMPSEERPTSGEGPFATMLMPLLAEPDRVSVLDTDLLGLSEERSASGEGPCATRDMPVLPKPTPTDSETSERSASGWRFFSRLWNNVLKR